MMHLKDLPDLYKEYRSLLDVFTDKMSERLNKNYNLRNTMSIAIQSKITILLHINEDDENYENILKKLYDDYGDWSNTSIKTGEKGISLEINLKRNKTHYGGY